MRSVARPRQLMAADNADDVRRMLYRPNYCANCGEKIERVEWGIFTSRRFCGVCESEFKGHDILTRAVVVVGVLAGVIGVGGYLRSDQSPPPTVARQATTLINRPTKLEGEAKPRPSESSPAPVRTPENVAPVEQLSGTKPSPVKTEIAEAAYICGAETKKGTPCSRRVKSNTRCYQHIGMPAMTNSERLKIN